MDILYAISVRQNYRLLIKESLVLIFRFKVWAINLDQVRKKGFSVNEAETFDYVYGIGAPIMDAQRRAIAGIAISGTKGSINVKTIPDLAKKVNNTAKMISQKLQEN